MSPDLGTAFRPSALAPAAVDDPSVRATGWAAGWAAGTRAAAERAAAEAAARAAEHADDRAHAARSLAGALAVLERAARAADARTVPVADEVRRQVYEAALAVAEAVLGHELASGPGSARSALTRALSASAELPVHTVRLAPGDLAHVRALLADGDLSVPAGVELVADPRLQPGDAISEHAGGFLDAQVSSALARARAALLEDVR